DAALAALAQEDAAAVGAVVEVDLAGPGPAAVAERRQPAEVGLRVPALLLDTLPFLVGDRDEVLLAAGAGDVTVPRLNDRQGSDRMRHEAGSSGRSEKVSG